jgi:diguanylate cyclase (GGDEF)-like protein
MGGEEILVLMPGITRAALAQRAEELRSRIARVRAEYDGTVLPPVTVSVGAALFPEHGRTATELLRAADDAMYAAKDGGRNQVRFPD